MRILVASTALVAVTALTAVPAAAQTPPGHGLTGPFTVTCPALGGDVQMTEPPGLAPSHWVVDGPHLVVQSIVITSDGGTLSENYGQKMGLPLIACTATHFDTDGTEYHAAVTFAVLPGA